ncbi:MAG: pitrilysin family protein [Bacillota bacterium]|nr:pitrilysin family protein [Bacillota bacterium]
MEFKMIEDKRLSEKLLYAKHETGLNIFICPKPELSKTYAMFGTKYGSIDRTFKTEEDADFVTVPDGIAHFLEHKMFENETGEDVFAQFGDLGASANAFTSFDKTVYEFSCTENFEKSLEVLLFFVQSPYFTAETVQKEQGIIGQEIRMYEDSATWRVFFNLLGAMYKEHPVNIDIAGTIDSISKINADILYKCYNTFYTPANMVLCICGNVTEEEVSRAADKSLREIPSPKFERSYPSEDNSVVQHEIRQKMSISIPYFNIGIKDTDFNLSPGERAKREAVMSVLLDAFAGNNSKLYKKLYEQGLINDSFGSEYTLSDSFAHTIFGGESKDPEKVFSIICEEIESFKNNKVDVRTFERSKKAVYGRNIASLDRTDSIVYMMISSYFMDTNFIEMFYAYDKIMVDDLNEILDKWTPEVMSLSIIDPLH